MAGPVKADARREAPARIAGRVGEAESPEVDGPSAQERAARIGAVGVGRGGGAPGEEADGGDPDVHQLDGCSGQIVGVEPAMLGVERGQQLFETRGGEGPSPAGHVSSKL